MTVYLDLLLCFNLLVHFCLLASTALLCGEKLKKGRLLSGTILGSIFSLAIFLEMEVWVFLPVKALMAASLVLVTFGFHSAGRFAGRLLVFLAVNFIYAGVMEGIAFLSAPQGMLYQSGVAYFGISTGQYVAGLLAAYLLLRVFVGLFNRRGRKELISEVRFVWEGRESILHGFYDSGNTLCDLFTGRPVLILSPKAAEKVLPAEFLSCCRALAAGRTEKQAEKAAAGRKLRVLPVHTVGKTGFMPVFLPDEIRVNGIRRDWMAGISRSELAGGCEALLPGSCPEESGPGEK